MGGHFCNAGGLTDHAPLSKRAGSGHELCTLDFCTLPPQACTVYKMSKRSRKVAFQEEVDISEKKRKGGEGSVENEPERSGCASFRHSP